MKRKIILVVFVLFFPTILLGQVYSVDSLRRLIEFSDTPDSHRAAREAAFQNPGLLEQILFIPKEERDNGVARSNAFSYLLGCSTTGVISKEHFFDLAFKLMKDIDQYAFPGQKEIEMAFYRGVVSNYGYDPINNTSFLDVFEMFVACGSSLNQMFRHGLISNSGVLNSLKQKLTSASDSLKKLDSKGKKPALNKLSAALKESQAQRGKHLSEDAYVVFSKNCENLIKIVETGF